MKYRLFVSSTLSAAIFKIYVEELKKIGAGMYFFGMLNLSSTYSEGNMWIQNELIERKLVQKLVEECIGMLDFSSTYRKGKYGSRMNWLKEDLLEYL